MLGLLASLALTGWLWQRQGLQPNALGRVEAVRVNIMSGVDGRLIPLSETANDWRLFDTVQEGQVVARLDDSSLLALVDALRGDMAAAQHELEAARAEAVLEQHDRQHEYLRERSRLACDAEKCRLDIVDRTSLIQQDRIQLQRLESQAEMVRIAREKGLVSAWETDDTEAERDIVTKRIGLNSTALEVAEENYRVAIARQKALPAPPAPSLDRLLAPLRSAVAAAEARLREVEVQTPGLVLRSPVTGKIAAIYCRPGQSVTAREWIMTITADDASCIVGYVRPEQRIRPVVGGTVGVRSRTPVARVVHSLVETVASQWEPLPPELARDQNVAELVLPVRIQIPERLRLRPGELVDLTFYEGRTSGD